MGGEVDFFSADKHKTFLKLIVSFWMCIVMHAQSTQKNKFTISLKYLKKNMTNEVDFLPANKRQRLLQSDTIILKSYFSAITFLFLRKNWVIKLIFLHVNKHESLLHIDTIILMGTVKHSQSSQNSKFAMYLQYLKKEVRQDVDFLHADKYQSFLQVDFNTLANKVFDKVILLSLIMWFLCTKNWSSPQKLSSSFILVSFFSL